MSNIFDRIVSESATASADDEISGLEAPPPNGSDDKAVGETERTSSEVRRAVQELLKHGFLEEVQKRDGFRLAVVYERAISTALEPLDLELRLDTHRGVAFLAVAQPFYGGVEDEASWTHPLVRRQRLTLEQSLLVAILRQAFVIHEQESGVGQSAAKISVEDLLPQFTTYFGDCGSDAKNESRLLNLLDQLKPYGIVSEVDKKHEVTICPLIAYLASPESLAALLNVLKEKAGVSEPEAHDN